MSTTPTLAMALKNLSEHSVDETIVPPYTHYNVRFESGDVLARYNNEKPSRDARVGAYLAHYHGDDAENETIVAQQVLKVLDAFSHYCSDAETFENHLKTKLSVPAERAAELAKLAPHISEAISRLPKLDAEVGWGQNKSIVEVIDFSQADSDLINAVSIFTESSENWSSQPESFLGTSPIVEKLMEKPAFTSWAAKETYEPMSQYPVLGVFEKALGYKNAPSLDEADKAQQALMRVMLLPRDSIELARMKNFHDEKASPNPFPIKGDAGEEFTFPDVQPYAIDVQTAAQMIRSMADVQANLSEAELEALEDIRLKWSYLSSREIIHVYSQEQAIANEKGQVTLSNKIDGMIGYTQELQDAADQLIEELGVDLGALTKLDQNYDAKTYHEARKTLLAETHALFAQVVPKTLYGQDKLIQQTLDRADMFVRVTDKQRAAYIAKLGNDVDLTDDVKPTEP